MSLNTLKIDYDLLETKFTSFQKTLELVEEERSKLQGDLTELTDKYKKSKKKLKKEREIIEVRDQ